MGRFLARRLLLTILVVLVTSIVAFSLVHLSGDPAVAMAGEGASAADVSAIRMLYGFDRPLTVQYFAWAGEILTGEFGRSYYLRESVVQVLAEHAPITAMLGSLALGFALLLAIPLGVLAALQRGGMMDRVASAVAVTGQAAPSFLLALLLIYIFGVQLHWLPISGNATTAHYMLPAVTLGMYATPALMRLTRSGMIEVMQSDHIRTARAYGLPPWRVVLRHALRSAIIPVVSLAAVQFGLMLGGSIVVEAVFSLKGLGQLAWESIQRSDIEVIQAILLLTSLVYAVLTLLADLLNALLDPRMRLT
jgi:ABC-type dipeptide/oligopeptide/nickel transport system permease component